MNTYEAANGMTLNLDYQPEVFVEDITILTNDEWLEYRKTGIGGSDYGILAGISAYKTPIDLYNDKTGKVPLFKIADGFEKPLNDQSLEELRMRYKSIDCWWQLEAGHALEESVALLFYQKTGFQPYAVRKMFKHPLYRHMNADVDYFVDIPDENGKMRTYILEIKTTSLINKQAWGTEYAKLIPESYELQGRSYASVCNVSGIIFACKVLGDAPDSLIIRRIERDLDKEAEIIEMGMNFWKYVENGERPPITEIKDGKAWLSTLRAWTEPNPGTIVNLDGELDKVNYGDDEYSYKELLDMWQEISSEKSALQAKINECESILATYRAVIEESIGINTNARIELPDEMLGEIKCKESTSMKVYAKDIERLYLARPDIYEFLVKEGYIKPAIQWRFNIKISKDFDKIKKSKR